MRGVRSHSGKQPKRGKAEYTNGQGGSFSSNLQAWGDRDVSTVYRDTCGKCGAIRVDRQIGLEKSPDEYLATMVAVFREVRRVLRKDGVCFVNMGDSYAGSQRATAYDKRDKEPASSTSDGCLCGSLCDVCRAAYRLGRFHSDGQRVPMPVASIASSIHEHKAAMRVHVPMSGFLHRPDHNSDAMPDLALVADHAGVPLPDAQGSTTTECEQPRQTACSPTSTQVGECLSCGRSLADCVPVSAGMAACTCDTEGGAWVRHTTGTDSSGLAYPGYTTAAPKPKDLLMMPARLALALQADGWWIRSQLPWVKRSCMPESTTDRPTSAIEYVYMLTKSKNYYWDMDAVKRVGAYPAGTKAAKGGAERASVDGVNSRPAEYATYSGTRNFRNSDLFFDSLSAPHGLITDADGAPLALDVNPAPFAGSHFATFPPNLIEPLILGGTSERGCCGQCGAPWLRITERGDLVPTRKNYDLRAYGVVVEAPDAMDQGRNRARDGHRANMAYETATTGWRPSCKCNADTVPCTVLDPFGGSGTTGMVADRLGRNAILIELNAEYVAMASSRITDDAPLLAQVSA